jgi:uncharacterized protein (DUF2062 family)
MTDPSQHAESTPGKGFLARVKHVILHPEMTPEQVALSFAIGLSLAWNPFIGLHTWIILLLCIAFRRLHRPLMLLVCYVNNPWTMVPMATASTVLGNVLLGRGYHLNLRQIHWHSIGWRSFLTREGFDGMFVMLKPILLPYLVGGLVLSALAGPVGYYFMLRLARRLRRIHLSTIHLPIRHPEEPR